MITRAYLQECRLRENDICQLKKIKSWSPIFNSLFYLKFLRNLLRSQSEKISLWDLFLVKIDLIALFKKESIKTP